MDHVLAQSINWVGVPLDLFKKQRRPHQGVNLVVRILAGLGVAVEVFFVQILIEVLEVVEVCDEIIFLLQVDLRDFSSHEQLELVHQAFVHQVCLLALELLKPPTYEPYVHIQNRELDVEIWRKVDHLLVFRTVSELN